MHLVVAWGLSMGGLRQKTVVPRNDVVASSERWMAVLHAFARSMHRVCESVTPRPRRHRQVACYHLTLFTNFLLKSSDGVLTTYKASSHSFSAIYVVVHEFCGAGAQRDTGLMLIPPRSAYIMPHLMSREYASLGPSTTLLGPVLFQVHYCIDISLRSYIHLHRGSLKSV